MSAAGAEPQAIMTDTSPPAADEAFRALGQIVLGERPLAEILEQVVHIAKQALPTSVESSITLLTGDEAHTMGFTGPTAIALDERQYEDESGPCLDAAASAQLVSVPDMGSETRWPRFAASAVEQGVHSSLSVPLPMQRQVTGALNFYAADADAFDENTISLAQTFAAHAAVAVANAHLYESTANLAQQMQDAMATRAVIEQAKGIIMRDRNCSADDAFNALVRLSQETHLKLRDVARQLVEHVITGSRTPASTENR
jgi:GAF domain-containing protein